MQAIRILVVDNSIFFRDELSDGLVRFLPSGSLVERASAPVEAQEKVRLFRPNAAVANYAMASIMIEGRRFFNMLAEMVSGPVIAFGAISNGRETALQSGALDYIMKPSDADVGPDFFKSVVSRIQLAITRYNLLPLAKTQRDEGTKPQIKPGSIMTRASWRSNSTSTAAKVSAPVKNGSETVSPTNASENNFSNIHFPRSFSSTTVTPAETPAATVAASANIAKIKSSGKKIELIAIGSSTGGTEALSVVLKALKKPLPPIVIVQHIPPLFSRLLSERLDEECVIHVKEAADGDIVQKNTAYIAPGSKHMTIARVAGGMQLTCKPGPRVHSCCPSVDVLFDTVVENIGGPTVLGIILTGMGHDGAEGLLKMRQAGSPTLGQDEATSVVYGMPRAAYEMGAVEHQLPLTSIAAAIMRIAGQ